MNRIVSSNIAKTETTYTCDTRGNLVLEEVKNKVVEYEYHELNQLVFKKDGNYMLNKESPLIVIIW